MIKMKAGTFGLPVNGVVKPMTKDSDPFEAGVEQEARLVKLGLAVYVDGGTTALPDGVIGIPEYSIDSSVNELREIGKLCGLTFKVGMTKAQMVEALDAHIAANTVDGDDLDTEDGTDEDAPEGEDTTKEPEEGTDEDAPTFDASEAVQ